MGQTTPYSYDIIQPDQIRLCRFVQDRDHLSASLETFSVDGRYPKYNALSYTWGEGQKNLYKNWTVQIGDQCLPVLDSLQSFVGALRSRGILLDGTWWWIDSICINQQNEQERSEQVRQIKRTFQKAHEVIVWLGEQSDDSDCALDFIHLLNEMDQAGCDNEHMRMTLQQVQYQAHWIALRNFFLRRWWTRVWTVQEFIMPSSVSFWCGSRDISREDIFVALAKANTCNSTGFKDTIAFHHAWNRRRAWLLYKYVDYPGLSLLALAAYFCNNEATDDRDRLYGLSGLCTENHALDINYSCSVDEVYLRFAQSFITQHKSLDIISFASLFTATPNATLPSWVPDWRARIQPFVVPLMASQSSTEFVGNLRPPRSFASGDRSTRYLAAGSKTAVCKFEGLALLAQGCIIDAVDGLAGTGKVDMIQSSQEHPKRSDAAACSPLDDLISVCRSLVLDREDRYLQRAMPAGYYYDFIHLCLLLVSGSQHPPILKEFQDWFEVTRMLHIHGKRLEDIVHELHVQKNCSNAFVAHPTPNQDEYIQDSFYGRFLDTIESMSRRLMTSKNGRIGMVSQNARKGDLVCILFGCSIPILLRRRREHEDQFTIVGECFLDGNMEGQALEQCESLERTFHII